MKLGFVGLGQMGAAMAQNLLAAGHQVTVYNRSRAKAEKLREHGATVADSPAAASRDAEVVFSMLADDPAVQGTVFGDSGIVHGLGNGHLHISCSTISVALAKTLATAHADKGQRYLSAPVFGRPDAAAAKKLVIVPAGDADLIEDARPLFEAIGRAVFIAGPEPWQANLFKLCGNFMLVSMVESFGEVFAALRKAGADPRSFYDAITEVFASPVYKNYGGIILDEKFDPPAFPLKLGFKDLRLALEAAQDLNVPMPIASVIRDQYLSALANGQEGLDWASVALVPARNAGLDKNGGNVPARELPDLTL